MASFVWGDWADVTAGSTGSWVDLDLTTAFGGDAGNVVGAIITIFPSTGSYVGGIRANGSTDTNTCGVRYYHKSAQWYCAVDSDDLIEVYRNNTNVKFYLVGYFIDDGTTEWDTNATTYTNTSNGSWQDKDVSSQFTGTAFAIMGQEDNLPNGVDAGMRCNGSTDGGYINDYGAANHRGFLLKVDGSEIFEIYAESYYTSHVCRVVGAIIDEGLLVGDDGASAGLDTNFTVLQTITSDQTSFVDLTTNLADAHQVAFATRTSGSGNGLIVRRNGDTGFPCPHNTNPDGLFRTWITETDGDAKVEWASIHGSGTIYYSSAGFLLESAPQQYTAYVGAKSALTDLVSYWKMDETSGNATDAHGSNDLTDNNTVGNEASGVINSGRNFDAAATEYLSSTASDFHNLGDFSLSVWVKPDTTTEGGVICGVTSSTYDNPFYLYLSGGKVYAYSYDSSWGDTGSDYSNEALSVAWHHIVVTFDQSANKLILYIDGVAQGNDSYGSGTIWQSTATSLEFGNYYEGVSDWPVDAAMDEAAWWNGRVLDISDVNFLYNGSSGRAYADLDGAEIAAATDTYSATVTPVAGGSTGTAAQSLPSLTQSATASLPASATAAQSLPSLTQSATASLPASATAAQSLPSLTQSATASLPASATAAQSLPSLTQSATASSPASATAAQSLPSLTQSATASSPASATATQTLPGLTQSATASGPTATGTVAQSLPSLTQSATAGAAASGTTSQSLPSLSQVLSGAVEVGCDGAQLLPSLSQAVEACVHIAALREYHALNGTPTRLVQLRGAATAPIWLIGTPSATESMHGTDSAPHRLNGKASTPITLNE